MVLETGVTAASFLLALALYAHLSAPPDVPAWLWSQVPFLLVIMPVWLLLLAGAHMYHTQRLTTVWRQGLRVLRTTWLGGIVLAALMVGADLELDRFVLLLFLLISWGALTLERAVMLTVMHTMRRSGGNRRNALLIGSGDRARAFAQTVAKHNEWGLSVIGVVTTDDAEKPPSVGADLPVLGRLEDVRDVLERHVVDEVVFCVHPANFDRIQRALEEAELRGLVVRLVADFVDLKVRHADIGHVDGLPILTFTRQRHSVPALAVKRLIDCTVGVMLLVLLAPLLLAVAVMVKLGSAGPVLFRQQRLGQNGRPFVMYKFRSMYPGAESAASTLWHRNEMDGPVFKLRSDPRVTWVGRWLRAWSLDELPQLWNVVRGDMSLVGPRPPLASEVSEYESWQHRRLSMKPGMTGPWQVSGRNDLQFDDWMHLDLAYIDNWSLGRDLQILARTIPAVLSGRGAC